MNLNCRGLCGMKSNELPDHFFNIDLEEPVPYRIQIAAAAFLNPVPVVVITAHRPLTTREVERLKEANKRTLAEIGLAGSDTHDVITESTDGE